MITFNKTQTFQIPIQFGDLNQVELAAAFTDGRVAGLLLERQLPKWFPTLAKIRDESSAQDLIDPSTGNKLEVRSVTKTGCQLLPARQIGAGRKYNEDTFLNYLTSTSAFVFVDIMSAPIFKVLFIKTDDLPLKSKLSRKDLFKLGLD